MTEAPTFEVLEAVDQRVWAPTVTGTRAVRPAARTVRTVAPSAIGSTRRPRRLGGDLEDRVGRSPASGRRGRSTRRSRRRRGRSAERRVRGAGVGEAEAQRLGSSSTGLPSTRTSVLESALPDWRVTRTVPGLRGGRTRGCRRVQVTSPAADRACRDRRAGGGEGAVQAGEHARARRLIARSWTVPSPGARKTPTPLGSRARCRRRACCEPSRADCRAAGRSSSSSRRRRG